MTEFRKMEHFINLLGKVLIKNKIHLFIWCYDLLTVQPFERVNVILYRLLCLVAFLISNLHLPICFRPKCRKEYIILLWCCSSVKKNAFCSLILVCWEFWLCCPAIMQRNQPSIIINIILMCINVQFVYSNHLNVFLSPVPEINNCWTEIFLAHIIQRKNLQTVSRLCPLVDKPNTADGCVSPPPLPFAPYFCFFLLK